MLQLALPSAECFDRQFWQTFWNDFFEYSQMAGGLHLQTLTSFTLNSTLHQSPLHSHPSPQLSQLIIQQVFECLAWARGWPRLQHSLYLNFSWLTCTSPHSCIVEALGPPHLPSGTHLLIPPLSLRAQVRPLFFLQAFFHYP